MPKHYAYRMDHDTGFAPHIAGEICSVIGCKCDKSGKKRNIEESAEAGSWVIGIGGSGTKQPDKLIYAMQVNDNISREQFKSDYRKESAYLKADDNGTRALISTKFYYFGENALTVPENLINIIASTQGCRLVSDENIAKLEEYFLENRIKAGKHGEPNNPDYKSNDLTSKDKSC